MRVLVQRSQKARCIVNDKTVGEIKKGLVLFVGFTEGDSIEQIEYLCKKVVNLSGDAYVKGVAKIRLLNCNDMNLAAAIGYTEGLNSNLPCEFEIKMKYIDGDYYVYDYKISEKDGHILIPIPNDDNVVWIEWLDK